MESLSIPPQIYDFLAVLFRPVIFLWAANRELNLHITYIHHPRPEAGGGGSERLISTQHLFWIGC